MWAINQYFFTSAKFCLLWLHKSVQGRSVYCHQFLPHNTNLLPFGTRKTLQVDLEHNIYLSIDTSRKYGCIFQAWRYGIEIYQTWLLSTFPGHGDTLVYKCAAGGKHNRLTSNYDLDSYNLTCHPDNQFSIPTWPTCAASRTLYA